MVLLAVGDHRAAVQLDGTEEAVEGRACLDERGAGLSGVRGAGEVAGQRVELGVGHHVDGDDVSGDGACVADELAAGRAVGDAGIRVHNLVLVDASRPHAGLALLKIIFVALGD
jgi:hypothetical protein